MIDLHCDTILKIYEHPETSLYENPFQLDLIRLKKSVIDVQQFALFVELSQTTAPYAYYQKLLACFNQQMAQFNEWITPFTTYDQYLKLKENNQLAALLTVEEGATLEGKLEHLTQMYEDEVRLLTLMWNFENEIGYPSALYESHDGQLSHTIQQGLKPFGYQVVEKMNELGMIIDVSHGSDQLTRDVLAISKQPIVASHSNCRALCPHYRNLPDDLIKKIANQGGLIGLNYFETFIRFNDETLLDQLCRHALHLKTVGGLECLALGSDFDGIPTHPELKDVTIVEQFIDRLTHFGFTARELDYLGEKNVTRLYREIL